MRKYPAPWLLLSGIVDIMLSGPTKGMDQSSEPSAFANGVDPTPAQAFQTRQAPQQRSPQSHVSYLRQLQNKQPGRDAIEQFAAGYQDHLQNPLQPLADNLESLTYEVFETDPIKYEWYERAIAAALRDWKSQNKPGSGHNGTIVVAIVGAGRGPLVTRALNASQATAIPIDCWALEKNQNAFVLLQRYFREKWHQSVNLVRSDMRTWKGPYHLTNTSTTPTQNTTKTHYKIDILVSELLGSFADNELSPECLDGVQHLLNPTHGISIPSSYTAHLTPIAAPKLHADILSKTAYGDKDAAQIPYVVLLHTIDYLSTHLPPRHPDRARNPAAGSPRPEPVPVILRAWEFEHPTGVGRGEGNEHNRRFARLEFRCRDRGVCHGLGGYFETVLYDPGNGGSAGVTAAGAAEKGNGAARAKKLGEDHGGKVELSTNPLTMDAKSRDMISWFPIFFPLKTPLYFPDNSLLVVSMWRQTDGRKVWYEWLVESFLLQSAAAGVGAQKRLRLGCSELHSSVNNGCLM